MSEKPSRKKSSKKSSSKREESSPNSKKSEESIIPAKSIPPSQPPTAQAEQNAFPADKKPLFFSETTQQVVSEDHPSHSRLVPIEDAFRYKISSMYNSVNTSLYPKREALQTHLRKFQWAKEDFLAVKHAIEMDMKSEFSAMNERLNAACGAKVAILEHTLENLHEDVERINFIIASVDNSSSDMPGFLQKWRGIKESMDVSLSKPFNTDLEVSADDLPVELSHIRSIAAEYSAVQALVALKDSMIRNIIHDKPSGTSFKEEISSWARLAEKMSNELNRLRMRCEYCNCELTPDTVNEPCPVSKNSFHFFKNDFAGKTTPKELEKLAKLVKKKKVNLEAYLMQRDPHNTGKLSPTDCYQLLMQLGLKNKLIPHITSYYSLNDGSIDYKMLVFDTNAILPKALKMLREKYQELAEKFREKDYKNEGFVAPEVFSECLREVGLGKKGVDKALKIADKDHSGNILFFNFLSSLRQH